MRSATHDDDEHGIQIQVSPRKYDHRGGRRRWYPGGKFDKKAGGAYQFSGGLHGVGMSVTNALSKRLEVSVTREGGVHHIVFAGGDVVEPLTQIRTAPKRASGTSVRVWPDATYSDSGDIPPAQLERVLCHHVHPACADHHADDAAEQPERPEPETVFRPVRDACRGAPGRHDEDRRGGAWHRRTCYLAQRQERGRRSEAAVRSNAAL